MITPPRRGKILDAAITGFVLIVFGVVPIAVLLSREQRRFDNMDLETAYIALVALSWPLFTCGGAMLCYFWRKDRAIDKVYFSTASPRQLFLISLALSSNTFGCVLLFIGILLSTVNGVQQSKSTLFIIFDVISMVLVLWIAYTLYAVHADVRRTKSALEEFAQNQAFADPTQDAPREQRGASEPQPQSADNSQPAYV